MEEKKLNYNEAHEILKSLDWHFNDHSSFYKAKVIGKISLFVIFGQLIIGLALVYILKDYIGDNSLRFILEDGDS